MYQIYSHVKPKKTSEYFGKYEGAYATFFINFEDIDGAFVLVKHYLENEEWEVIEIEDEYFKLEDKSEMDVNYIQYFDEALEYGYSIVFNIYEKE